MNLEKLLAALNSDRDELANALRRATLQAEAINNGISGTIAFRLDEIEDELRTAARLVADIRKLIAGEGR